MLETEERNSKTILLDKESTENMLRLFQTANEESVQAVEKALPNIVKAVDAAAESIAAGGLFMPARGLPVVWRRLMLLNVLQRSVLIIRQLSL